MSHDIRLAVASDYPAICAYLEAHWRKGHIFTKSKVLFDWQHWNEAKQVYHFILGCAPDGSIHGVLGFIPHGQFDPALGYDSIWLCIWHASVKGTGLGRRLLDWLEETYRPTFLATNGASEMSLPLYQARGWETGKLEHWYIEPSNVSWRATSDVVLNEPACLPRKSDAYIHARYLRHPFYEYVAIHRNPRIQESVAVVRQCINDGKHHLRVVDLVGDPRVILGMRIGQLLNKEPIPFIDFYCIGVDHEHLREAGFTRRIGDEVIIPNYFEPYEHRNVDINYAVKAPKGMPWRIVKGDGDQDRPNVLP